MKDFDGKVVVITGATSGIGAATAKAFAEEGAVVLLVGRNSCKGIDLESEIINAGGKAKWFCCDVSQEKQVAQLASEISDLYKGVDILFNNAGIMFQSEEIDKLSIDSWKNTFNVNINGIFFVTRYLKKLLLKKKGCIVNNASIAGMHSYVAGRSYAYSASKAAVIQFTRQMAYNYAAEGVRVNCICPGIINTKMLGDRNLEQYAERIPLGYVGQPLDVAKVVLFLASSGASYITGAVIPIDGGASL